MMFQYTGGVYVSQTIDSSCKITSLEPMGRAAEAKPSTMLLGACSPAVSTRFQPDQNLDLTTWHPVSSAWDISRNFPPRAFRGSSTSARTQVNRK